MNKQILSIFFAFNIYLSFICSEIISIPIDNTGYTIDFDEGDWECQNICKRVHNAYFSAIEGKSISRPVKFYCWNSGWRVNAPFRTFEFMELAIKDYKKALEPGLAYGLLKLEKNTEQLPIDKISNKIRSYSIVTANYTNSHTHDENGMPLYCDYKWEYGRLMGYMLHSRNEVGYIYMLVKITHHLDGDIDNNQDFKSDQNDFERAYSLITPITDKNTALK